MLFPKLANQLQHSRGRGTGLQGAVSCHLVDHAVREGVAERQTELDEVGSSGD